MKKNYAAFSIDLECKFNRSRKGSINYRYGEQLLRKEYPNYVKDLYANINLSELLNDISDQIGREFARHVKYELFDHNYIKMSEPILDENDIEGDINNLLYVGFYADPEFYNIDNVCNLYDKTVIFQKQDNFNVELISPPAVEKIKANVLANIALILVSQPYLSAELTDKYGYDEN